MPDSNKATKGEVKARMRGTGRRGIKFGDVRLCYGPRGWYVKGFARVGHKPTLPEMKEAVELLAIESILNDLCAQGIMERVPA